MGSTIQVIGSGTYTTSFMKIAGFPTLDIGTTSTSAWGLVRMRVAMVLDNTGSMADDGKIPAMQAAAKNLVDQLSCPRQDQWRRLHLDRAVRQGRQCRRQQLQQVRDRLQRLGHRQGSWSCTSGNNNNCNNGKWTPANHNTWTGCVVDRDQDYDTKNTTPAAPTKFYLVTQADQTASVFIDIGTSLSKLRVAR